MAIRANMVKDVVSRQIDIGYGFLKYIDSDGTVKKVKAVVAALTDSMTDTTSDVLTVDGVSYIIGDTVYKLGRTPITANDRVGRYKSVAYRILGLYALAKTYEQSGRVSLLTGLPFMNMDEADQVKEVFTGSHQVTLNGRNITLEVAEVRVGSQGLGSYYSLVRQRGAEIFKRRYLLVDLGYGTINYVPVNSGDIDAKMVKTNRDLGIQNAYRRIADQVNLQYKTNYEFYDVDRLLDVGVQRDDLDKGTVYAQIKDEPYVDEAFNEYARNVWTDIATKYNQNQLEAIDEIVFTGGTAERVWSQLYENRRRYSSIIENPQDAQVLGYAELAKKLELEAR